MKHKVYKYMEANKLNKVVKKQDTPMETNQLEKPQKKLQNMAQDTK